MNLMQHRVFFARFFSVFMSIGLLTLPLLFFTIAQTIEASSDKATRKFNCEELKLFIVDDNMEVFGKTTFKNKVKFRCGGVFFGDNVKFADKVTFKDDVKFKDEVTFKDDVVFEDDVIIEGILSATDLVVLSCMDSLCVNNLSVVDISITAADIACDLTVGCNISMNDSVSSSVGNIIKAGNSFIHNFGPDNVFVGINAGNFTMLGFGNIGVGPQAVQSNTTGLGNTGFGYQTLRANTTGSGNVAVGPLALTANTTASINTAMGTLSLQSNITGNANCGFGFFSLSGNTMGNDNTAIGTGTLSMNTIGNDNTAVGTAALSNKIAGSRNVALGKEAGVILTSGDDNIYIVNNGIASESNTIRIGSFGAHNATFIQGIFGATIGGGGLPVEVDAAGQLGTIVSSSAFKQDIENMGINSEGIYQLRPVKFVYKNDKTHTQQYGLIAEEVAQVFPDLVVYDLEGKPHSVRYQILPVLLLNETQKQRHELQLQRAYIAALARRVAELENRA